MAESGESHTLMKGEQGGCSSGSSLHSSMAGIAMAVHTTLAGYHAHCLWGNAGSGRC